MLFNKKQSLFKKISFGNQDAFFSPLSDYFFPYACHLSDDILVTKNGNLMQIISIELNDFKRNQEGGLRDYIRSALLSNIDDLKTSFWVQTVKRRIKDDVLAETELEDINFQSFLNRDYLEYTEKLNNYKTFLNITIVRQGMSFALKPKNIIKHLTNFFKKKHKNYIENEMIKLKNITNNILQSISDFNPKILSIKENEDNSNKAKNIPLPRSEIIEYLNFLSSFEDQKCHLDEVDISRQINQNLYSIKDGLIIIKNKKTNNKKYVVNYSLKEIPVIPINVITQVLNIPSEMIITEYVSYIDKKEAISFFKDQMQLITHSNDKDFQSLSAIEFLTKPEKEVKYCKSSVSITVIARDYVELGESNRNATQIFAECGVLAVKEDISCQKTYLSIFPANFNYIHRMSVHDAEEIGMFSYSFVPVETDETIFINDKKLFTFGTLKNNPVIFGILKENPNIIINGNERSGKTVLSNFIVTKILDQDPKIEINIIDLKNKSRSFTEAIEGSWYQVSLNRESNSSTFNPLDVSFFESEELMHSYLTEFFSLLLASSNVVISPSIYSQITSISDRIIELKRSGNKIALHNIRNTFKEYSDIDKELASWHSIGRYYHLFDNKNDSFQEKSRVKCFYLDEKVQSNNIVFTAIVNHLIHNIIYRKKDKSKYSILIIEEPFFVFGNPFFKSKINDLIDKLADNKIILILKIEDISKENATIVNFSKLIDSCPTQFYFGNKLINDNYSRIFDLKKYELLTIKTLGQYENTFLLKQKEDVFSCNFSMKKIPKTINLLSDNHEIRALILSIKESTQSDLPARWLNAFYSDRNNFLSQRDEKINEQDIEAIEEMKHVIEN